MAGDDAAGRPGNFDALTAQGLEEFRGGGVVAHGERERFELLGEGRGGVVVDAAYAASVVVEDREGLEDVVELGRGEVDGDALVAGDLAEVFEVADAVFIENNLGDGELVNGG